MFCQIFLMVSLRSHYTLDMLAAVIFGHYLFIMAERYSYLVDWYIFGIPLAKRLVNNNCYHEGAEYQETGSTANSSQRG